MTNKITFCDFYEVFIVFSFSFHYNINKGEMPAILSFPSYCKVKTIGRLVFLGRTKIYLPGTLSDTYCPDGVQTPTKNKKHAFSVLNFETVLLRLLYYNDNLILVYLNPRSFYLC